MKALEAERVIRIHIEFSNEEAAHLKRRRCIPPEARLPVRMWLTPEELLSMEERGEIAPGTLAALPLKVLPIQNRDTILLSVFPL